MFRDMKPEEKAMIQEIVDHSFRRFKAVVSEGRELSMVEVNKLATGAVFTADQALELKLVDKIGYLEEALEEAKFRAGLAEASVVRYDQRVSALRMLLSGKSQGGELTVRLDAPMLDWPRAGLYYIWEPALGD